MRDAGDIYAALMEAERCVCQLAQLMPRLGASEAVDLLHQVQGLVVRRMEAVQDDAYDAMFRKSLQT